MTRVVLDEFARAKWRATPEQLAAVVAELRAAREVVEAAAQLMQQKPEDENWVPLVNAFDSYVAAVA